MAMKREYHSGASPPGRLSASNEPSPFNQPCSTRTTGTEWFATISACTSAIGHGRTPLSRPFSHRHGRR